MNGRKVKIKNHDSHIYYYLLEVFQVRTSRSHRYLYIHDSTLGVTGN